MPFGAAKRCGRTSGLRIDALISRWHEQLNNDVGATVAAGEARTIRIHLLPPSTTTTTSSCPFIYAFVDEAPRVYQTLVTLLGELQ
jgi:hypothetical protein